MITFGTIGTGWITASFIKAAQETKGLSLTAVFSRSTEKALEFADIHHAPQIFTDLEEMANSNEIEAVYIASPNSLHYEQAIMFLKHGKHVICEKPIFSNTREWDQAHKVAEDNGVFLFEAIRNIHSPNFKRLKSELPQIGKVRSAMLNYLQYSSRYDLFLKGEEPNVFSSDFSGGALVDLGVYPLYLAVGLFGQPEEVSYHPVILRSGIDGNGTLILKYPDFTCTIVCSKISHSSLSSEIHGEKGTLLIDKAAPITKIEYTDGHSKEVRSFETDQHEHDMIYEIENIVGIIETKNQQEYAELSDLSRLVLAITETARKQSGIVFAAEK